MIIDFFEFLVKKAKSIGLVKYYLLSVDGTFFKAYANINNRISRKQINLLIKILKKVDFADNENKLQKSLLKYFIEPTSENKTKEISKILKKFKPISIDFLKEGVLSVEGKNNVLSFLDEILSYHSDTSNFDINLTYPESSYGPSKKGNKQYQYNFQAVTDSYKRIIVSIDLVNDSNDSNQLINMIKKSMLILGSKPKFFVADNGYYTYDSLYWCYINNINLIIPDRSEAERNNEKDDKKSYKKHTFKYDYFKNTFTCKHGVCLHYSGDRRVGKYIYHVYTSDECKKCEYLSKCTSNYKKEILDSADPLNEHFNMKYYSEIGQRLYKQRAPLSETVFAIFREINNFSGLKRIGAYKSLIILYLESIVHNIKIIHQNTVLKNKVKEEEKHKQTTFDQVIK